MPLSGLFAVALSLILTGRITYGYLISGGVTSLIVSFIFLYLTRFWEDEKQLYDSLTGMPNRILFYDRLSQAVSLAKRKKQHLAVMFLSIDHFKLINNTLGHAAGDMLLKATAQRMRDCLRGSDTLARPGRDEFMVLLPEIRMPEDARVVAEKITFATRPSLSVIGHELSLSLSIGIGVFPKDGDNAEALLSNAYTAMSFAQNEGGNKYRFYSPVATVKAFEKLLMENNLRKAIEKEEFLLYYQPQIDLDTEEIIGMEALLRWQHPDFGLIAPSEFIPIAEQTGLIIPLGQWVLRTACAQNKAWQKAGLKPIRIAVNVSPVQFQHDLTETISKVLKETDLKPEFLELEITENIIMRNDEAVLVILSKLREMGIYISIDDFGTGYSSLSYLKYFPIDKLKIVQSFVRSITLDPDDAAIAKTIVTLANDLHLKTIAEGVETKEQLEFLRSIKCNEVQGYLFSRPMPAEEVEKLLSKKTESPNHWK